MGYRTKLYIETLLLIGAALVLAFFINTDGIGDKETLFPTEINASENNKDDLSEQKTAQETLSTRTGLVLNKEGAWPSFTLLPESGSAKIKLLNMSGDIVHSWDFDAARARLLPNCNLLVVHGTKWGWSQEYWSEMRKHVREYDWDGNVVWEHSVPSPAHHDVRRLENGNTLLQYRSFIPKDVTQKIADPKKRNAQIRTDILLEVNNSGKVVWEWTAHEHVDVNSCGKNPCPKTVRKIAKGKRTLDWTHNNTTSLIPPNKWYDAGDSRFKPGNVMVMFRNWSEAFIIDKESKEVVWTYSGTFQGGLSGGHEAHMIGKGLNGAGNILIFDNGRERKQSAVLEIRPDTKEVVWNYTNGKTFFSQAAGSIQRLENGNTLISEDVPGNVFEINSQKELVWSFKAPMRTARARKYSPNHCPNLSKLELF